MNIDDIILGIEELAYNSFYNSFYNSNDNDNNLKMTNSNSFSFSFSFDIVGHSLGGRLAMVLLMSFFGPLVNKAVAIDVGPFS